MPTLPPDPSGPHSSAQHASDDRESVEEPAAPGGAARESTRSHNPPATPAGPPAVGSDIFALLNNPRAHAGLEGIENTDDAPTVITRGGEDRASRPKPPGGVEHPQIAGRRLGNYELIEAIGSGGMATVLKARDLELGRVVALKILPPNAARDPECVTRFKQEARAAALLDHENVARVYACGEDQSLHFIAFEFVEGINLRQLIERAGSITAGDAVRYMIQVAAGLAHAAERGVVHRDIKPSNILITPDRRAKIVDMGLARQLETPANGALTQSGVTLGTFDYISPEQALDPRRTDVRSDIYSLGCTFYHALTGRPPVPEGTAAKKLHAHQHTDPLDPRQIKDDIPDELVVVLARMMAKDPEQRYQSPQELIAHLKGLAERLRLSPEAVTEDAVVRGVRAQHSLQPPQLHLGWAVGVAAVVVAIAAFALSGDLGSTSTSPPWADEPPPRAKLDPVSPNGAAGRVAPEAPADNGIVATVEELAEKIADANTRGPTTIRLGPGVYDLTQLPDAVVFRGKELILQGSANQPTILRVAAAPATTPGTFGVMGAESVAITWVRFEMVAPQDAELAEGPPTALQATDVANLTLTDCVFSASENARADGAGAVRVSRECRAVRAERCVFAPAAFALWLPDSCRATIFDCGFGPADAAIRVGDLRPLVFPLEAPPQDVEIALKRSSFLLDATAAVLANDAGTGAPGVRVAAEYCVFAAHPRIDPLVFFPGVNRLLPRPALVRAQQHPAEIQFTGVAENAYYGIAALALATDGGVLFYDFPQCKEKQFPIADAHAVLLGQRPWADRVPLQTLAERNPWRAFGLNLKDPDLFTTAQMKVLGAQFHDENNILLTRRAYPDPELRWPPDPPKNSTQPRSNVLVWYPNPRAEDYPLPQNTYKELVALLNEARPDDITSPHGVTILIRHNGLLELRDTIKLEKPRNGNGVEFRVTFKPDEGYTPILAAKGGPELDQTLFKLMSGHVTFQRVQFLLRLSRPRDLQTVAAVAVIGGESCTFRDCVFTLAEEYDSKAVAVLVTDPSQLMAMDGVPRPMPQLKFEQCVIRGKGRGIWVKASRAVAVDLSQSLTALDGALFFAEPGGKMAPGARSTLRLSRVTAFAGGPMVEMRGGRVGEMRVSGLVPLDVHADECLFAAVPGAGRPLVELDGIDPDDAMKLLPWQVQFANRYANFDESATVMLIRPLTEGTMPKELNWSDWIAFASEKPAGGGKRLGKVTFEAPPTGLALLAALKPTDVAVRSMDFTDVTGTKPIDVGAAIERLPTPAKPEPPMEDQ